MMKYIDEYRTPEIIKNIVREIANIATKQWNIMEICGGQTNTILKYSLEELLSEKITMIHGPGCPVCVTPVEKIDKAIEIARQGAILTSFGDMLRVPGSDTDLLGAKASGADVRMVYSPLDSLKIAEDNTEKQVVFFAVGFETTSPAVSRVAKEALRRQLKNFSLLVSHVLVPPAVDLLLSSENSGINAVLAAGHVCTVMGYKEYIALSEKYKIPIVVTGFEPSDILNGILLAVRQLELNRHEVENQYSRAVTKDGNLKAQMLIDEVFDRVDMHWRGIGNIPGSGLKLREAYSTLDAENRFNFEYISNPMQNKCIAGAILRGINKPPQCPMFNSSCTPEHPLGAPMVSSEGACAAYYFYKKG